MSGAPADEEKTVEQRFQEWRARKEAGHPLYQTSSKAYGKVPTGVPVTLDAPAHGRKGDFTTTFVGSGNYRDSGLTTSVSKSRTHSSKDGVL